MARIPRDKKEAEDFVHRALEPWRLSLLLSANGTPKTCLANALIAFRGNEEWHDVLQFDAFQQRTMLNGKLPWCDRHESRAWAPTDDGLAANWLQHQGIMLSPKSTSEAIEIVARDSQFHPVLEYLKNLKWDGEERLDKWVINYLGVKDTNFARSVASCWMISAVARVMEPGCKADCALILEGRQGLGKSQAIKALFAPWFTDEISELGTKDAAIAIAGVWCVELAELVGMRKADIDRTKAFMSRTNDHFRPVWGSRAIDQPRQCVFAGTVNDSEYLRDETGARRFWPLLCLVIDLEGLRAIRDQLWAEAKDRYLTGENWWLNEAYIGEEAALEQEHRRVIDPWQKNLEHFLKGHASVLPSEFLAHLGMPIQDQGQREQNRVVAILKALGWRKMSLRIKGVATPRQRYVHRDTDEEAL